MYCWYSSIVDVSLMVVDVVAVSSSIAAPNTKLPARLTPNPN